MARKTGRGRPPLSLVGQESDVRFYARHAREAGGPVLILGCGSGRLALALADAGVEVLGVDPSARMVASAEALRAAADAEVAARLRFLTADLRALRLAERFPLVAAPHNALGLMDSPAELESLLTTVRHHLAPGGRFVFDLLNARDGDLSYGAEDREPSAPLEPLRPVFTPHLRERRRDGAGRVEAGGIRRLRLRPFRPEEVDRALRAVGLEARERYGRFDGRVFSPTDERQVVVAGVAGG
ncbi:MAG: class I SAM-dependent methyltransferase [Myxococcaceae bacterium]|nr:class I SAM-dependent methyltransferase [Myxococcaceae bacterium]MCI0669167.1 class I SAM-dependent methyltransferase [Myxococcaceae bacterium]